ncbi:hypothetical protein NCG97_36525 [Streptomyces lydicamycinicus]|uniref:Decaprenylphosphoryl-beta-D-ribose oxidase n=1 Tax=Streptomyces lydicamycinicus TaxID=1546107 RepID=A0A0P4R5T6_9ACTN|nr:hypothetical protein [Streptomyces lydicamycinicus]USA04901.1 hypothetical protein NCG97_36525 [Streptomyces lydicamycinicus]GAO08260.1 decaprenylphosphoryl-beta-D-ribose oxidase [Streptomyces lydicamycinicus]
MLRHKATGDARPTGTAITANTNQRRPDTALLLHGHQDNKQDDEEKADHTTDDADDGALGALLSAPGLALGWRLGRGVTEGRQWPVP